MILFIWLLWTVHCLNKIVHLFLFQCTQRQRRNFNFFFLLSMEIQYIQYSKSQHRSLTNVNISFISCSSFIFNTLVIFSPFCMMRWWCSFNRKSSTLTVSKTDNIFRFYVAFLWELYCWFFIEHGYKYKQRRNKVTRFSFYLLHKHFLLFICLCRSSCKSVNRKGDGIYLLLTWNKRKYLSVYQFIIIIVIILLSKHQIYSSTKSSYVAFCMSSLPPNHTLSFLVWRQETWLRSPCPAATTDEPELNWVFTTTFIIARGHNNKDNINITNWTLLYWFWR